MKTIFFLGLMAGLLLTTTGCAPTALVARQATRSGRVYGDYGVTGYGSAVTLENGSRLSKLSIVGDGNNIAVEDDVRIYKIEIWGSNNRFDIPAELSFTYTEVGKNNQFVRRPPLPVNREKETIYTDITIPADGGPPITTTTTITTPSSTSPPSTPPASPPPSQPQPMTPVNNP